MSHMKNCTDLNIGNRGADELRIKRGHSRIPLFPSIYPWQSLEWRITSLHLNREYAKAKGCMKNLIASDCHFTSSEQEVIDLGLSDWNPFCENNRDPGATGKDQCDGVKKLNNPLHSNGPASAKMKVGVTYALLIPFVLPLVFSSRMWGREAFK